MSWRWACKECSGERRKLAERQMRRGVLGNAPQNVRLVDDGGNIEVNVGGAMIGEDWPVRSPVRRAIRVESSGDRLE
jgi:hypothetical protein